MREHHKKHPDWYVYGSETSSTVQSRGIYHFPYRQSVLADEDEQCSSFGNSSTSWGAKIQKRALLQSGIVNFHSDNICGRDLIILESRHHIIPEIPILDRLIRQDFPRILIICIRRHGLTAEKTCSACVSILGF